ncbi:MULTISPECIES: exodeoxyribonuclease VII large subunit [Bacillaceae]|uniref:Exodeoxyribonuclease 7 large subunit n=1 Tax=Evansella alkalicola TaxID=745819 RepID=A0ABS6JZY2_9BACI|nr:MULTISPECIES: exodeoxyribonuclease VII large subunit [Bacillaceae]MBU9724160.1 exodeoxyribonuclease VII large subunit [Bacillus alkalicola]
MKQEFLSVSDLTRRIKRLLDTDNSLRNVWIRAEISNFSQHSRGHMYFTLKDDGSKVNSVMFAGNNRFLKFRPKNGMSVLVRGDISVYEPHGQYQLYVKEMQPDGIGNLYLAYEELKRKLEMAGYFSDTVKKKIPLMPKSIGVITSPTGAAVRDIITTLGRRFPVAQVTLLPVLVQGAEAAPSITRAIQQANEAAVFDVLIVGRGGGSLEELWAFNEQVVAEAIYKSSIPIISAVGHETDITISDFVADLRAPTPTAAAELAVPDMVELKKGILERRNRLSRGMQSTLSMKKEKLLFLEKSYAFRYPKQLLEQKEQELDRLVESLSRETKRLLEGSQNKFREINGRLHRVHPQIKVEQEKLRHEQLKDSLKRAMTQLTNQQESKFSILLSKLKVLSPLNMMDRGYSLAYNDDGKLIKTVDDVKEDTELTIRLQDGRVLCDVKERTYEDLTKGDWSEKNE